MRVYLNGFMCGFEEETYLTYNPQEIHLRMGDKISIYDIGYEVKKINQSKLVKTLRIAEVSRIFD